jgi:16S rRNA (cytosine967-C5)-methyltransferase
MGERSAVEARPTARHVAFAALRRIEGDGAYANLVLRHELGRSGLDERDRGFVTELVYGTTRRRRACDYLVDRFISRPVDGPVRTVLRLGAYQLAFAGVAPHAAVGETVSLAPRAARGFVNAVLRKVASTPVAWPDTATELSYPDWIVDRLTADLGRTDALAALDRMNERASVTERGDGYVQDTASQWVAGLVDSKPELRVADLCAAPGGKATALAGTVVAGDLTQGRVRLVAENAEVVDVDLSLYVGDGRHPPLRSSSFDRVLVDAPCSGLGALRRRPDARWRIEEAAVERLGKLQRELVDAAVALLAPGGLLVYSVCTLTAAESIAVDEHLARVHPELEPVSAPAAPWRPWGRGALLLPHDADTDGMAILRLRRP